MFCFETKMSEKEECNQGPVSGKILRLETDLRSLITLATTSSHFHP